VIKTIKPAAPTRKNGIFSRKDTLNGCPKKNKNSGEAGKFDEK